MTLRCSAGHVVEAGGPDRKFHGDKCLVKIPDESRPGRQRSCQRRLRRLK